MKIRLPFTIQGVSINRRVVMGFVLQPNKTACLELYLKLKAFID